MVMSPDEPNEERIRFIRQERWIGHPLATDVVTQISTLISYPRRSRMPSLLLYGAPGMGKTTIIQKVLRDHSANVPETNSGVIARPLVAMQMPPEPFAKDFYDELLRAMGSIALHPTAQSGSDRVRIVAKQIGLRVLVIDEIHNMLAGTPRQQRVMLHALRFLANDLQIALVGAGTDEAAYALETDQQLLDRFDAVELPPWHDGPEFARLLRAFSGLLPLRNPVPLWEPQFRKRILDLTEGVMVRICRVIESIAVSAIESGTETIAMEMLRDDLISPSLASLSRGRSRRRGTV
jgi:replication-associated recombination protein RarA